MFYIEKETFAAKEVSDGNKMLHNYYLKSD